GRLTRVDAAKGGLRAVGWVYPKEVCGQLERVLTNPSRLFNWGTHEAVIVLLGDLDCGSALPTLRAYRGEMGTGPPSKAVPALAAHVGETQPPDASSVKAIRDALDRTIGDLEKHGGAGP